jgi:phosphoenolpyruvate synthase/pyruvate phosphate dikinase
MTRRPSFMDRGSFAKPNIRASVLLSGNREQLVPLADLSLLEFDASLGCPLATYEDATLALVGGKALQCWRLMKHGLPVPPAFVIPTYVYSLHVGEAGVADLINDVFSCNLGDATAREELTVKLETIRTKITSTPLDPEVIDNLKSFLHTLKGKSVSVRSSASAEDLGSQSFAGQYDTYLYKTTIEEVCDSIKACWASMFKAHILDYASKPVFLDAKVGDDSEPEVFTPGQMKPPHMGVLIMKMVEAKSSGVCFSKNLWGKADEIMVEAVLGQGEGLVGGEITPDRYVVGKYTSKLCFQELSPQTHKFVRSSNMDGVEKIALAEPFEGSVLSPRNIKVTCLSDCPVASPFRVMLQTDCLAVFLTPLVKTARLFTGSHHGSESY